MALNKVGRVLGVPPGEAGKLVPPEIIKYAAEVRKAAGGPKAEKKGK